MKVQFGADKVKVNGPKVDGSYSITFETGEYERENVAKVLAVEPGRMLKITLEVE